jgi:hypothetical protein
MMPMQLSSEQSLRAPLLLLLTLRFVANSLPQWGQNLAHNGDGFLHLSQVSLGMGAPQSVQVSCMKSRFLLKIRLNGHEKDTDRRRY